jgi:hypothetical protein
MGGVVAALVCHLLRVHMDTNDLYHDNIEYKGNCYNNNDNSNNSDYNDIYDDHINNHYYHHNDNSNKSNTNMFNDQNSNKDNYLKNSKIYTDSRSFCCITYGCPSSVCTRLAECMDKYVTCVVLHDDIIRYLYVHE